MPPMRLSPPKIPSRIASAFCLGLAYVVPIMAAGDSSPTSPRARAVAGLVREFSFVEYGVVILFVVMAVMLYANSVSSWTWLAIGNEKILFKSWMTLFRVQSIPVASIDSFGRDEHRPNKVKVVIGAAKKAQQKINYLLATSSYDLEELRSVFSEITGKAPGLDVSH